MARALRCWLRHIDPFTIILIAGLSVAATRAADPTAAEPESRPARILPAPIPKAALERMPEDATAYCADGTWSNAVEKQGSCPSNGGVKVWFGPAPAGTTGRCMDGTYTRAKKGTYGACSGCGGVRFWLTHPTPAAQVGH